VSGSLVRGHNARWRIVHLDFFAGACDKGDDLVNSD
jgi:hypothetical protein